MAIRMITKESVLAMDMSFDALTAGVKSSF